MTATRSSSGSRAIKQSSGSAIKSDSTRLLPALRLGVEPGTKGGIAASGDPGGVERGESRPEKRLLRGVGTPREELMVAAFGRLRGFGSREHSLNGVLRREPGPRARDNLICHADLEALPEPF